MKKGKMRERTKKILFVLSFVLLFFAVRLHFYRSPLTGEEGMFADLVVNRHQGPDFLLSSRIDGENRYFMPRHPDGLYYVIRTVGFLFSPLTDRIPWQDNEKITPALRLLFSMFQFIILSAIAIYLALRKSRIGLLLAMIVLAVSISPIAIHTSVNLQVDGSIGVLMNGLFAIVILLILSSSTRNAFSYIILFSATFFLATGKQEWSFILVVALFLTVLYTCYIRKKDSAVPKLDSGIAIAIISGLLAGHITSYLIGPQNYMGAFGVLWHFSRAEDLLSGQIEVERWITVTSSRLRWICTVAALAAISSILVFGRLKELKPLELLIWLYGLGLFGAFFISSNSPSPRYFAPSLVTLTIAIVAISPPNLSKSVFIAITTLIILMFATSGIYLYNNIVKKSQKPYFDASEMALKHGQIAILSTAQAWNKPDIDFVNYDAGKESAERVAARYNKTLYPENFTWWSDSFRKKSPE